MYTTGIGAEAFTVCIHLDVNAGCMIKFIDDTQLVALLIVMNIVFGYRMALISWKDGRIAS